MKRDERVEKYAFELLKALAVSQSHRNMSYKELAIKAYKIALEFEECSREIRELLKEVEQN